MGVGKRQRAIRAMRGQMWSPGRPSVRGVRIGSRFWEAIAAGARARTRRSRSGCRRRSGPVVPRGWRDAADLVGPAVGALPVVSPSGRRSRSCAPSASACARSPAGWVGRRRRSRGSCAATRRRAAARLELSGDDRAVARRAARQPPEGRRSSPRTTRLREYVQDRLAGTIARPDGEPVPGPDVRWIGRATAAAQDRRWASVVEPGADREPAAARLPR